MTFKVVETTVHKILVDGVEEMSATTNPIDNTVKIEVITEDGTVYINMDMDKLERFIELLNNAIWQKIG